jgi:hypothetical protein
MLFILFYLKVEIIKFFIKFKVQKIKLICKNYKKKKKLIQNKNKTLIWIRMKNK